MQSQQLFNHQWSPQCRQARHWQRQKALQTLHLDTQVEDSPIAEEVEGSGEGTKGVKAEVYSEQKELLLREVVGDLPMLLHVGEVPIGVEDEVQLKEELHHLLLKQQGQYHSIKSGSDKLILRLLLLRVVELNNFMTSIPDICYIRPWAEMSCLVPC